jgi:hypothetical protein
LEQKEQWWYPTTIQSMAGSRRRPRSVRASHAVCAPPVNPRLRVIS